MWSQIHSLQVLLQWQNLFASFRFENLRITGLGPLLGNQWQSSIFEESTSLSSILEIFKAVSFKSFWLFLSGIPLIYRHSHLEYSELLQHWRSKETIWSFSLLLTCLATLISDGSLMQFCFRYEWSFVLNQSSLVSLESVFILVKVVSYLVW